MATIDFQSDHFTLEQLADGVYAAIAADEGGAFANAGIVDTGDHTLLFDSCVTPQAAHDLYRAAQTLTGRAPSHAILSHGDFDHYTGAQIFPSEVDLISTPIIREKISADAKNALAQDRQESINGLTQFLHSLKSRLENSQEANEQYDIRFQIAYITVYLQAAMEMFIRVPEITFEKSLTFHGKKRSVSAMTFGGGHSASDVVLHLPDDKILFTGDLISVQRHPFLGTGNLPEWLRILDEMKSLNAQVFISGHGPVGSLQDVDDMSAYIAALSTSIQDFVIQGGNAETVHTIPMPEFSKTWLYGTWTYPINLRVLYQQFISSAQPQS